jgi:hypothetical protein
MIESAQDAAAEAASKADQELGLQTSGATQRTAELRQRAAAEAAAAEAARDDLKAMQRQLADAVAKDAESDKRGEAFEKNVRVRLLDCRAAATLSCTFPTTLLLLDRADSALSSTRSGKPRRTRWRSWRR